MQLLLLGLKAAAEPTRLRLLALCAHSDLTVSELTQILGQSQPRVSLREGNWAYFRLASDGPGAELARTLVDSLQVDDPVVSLDLERLETVMHARAQRAADYFRRNAAKWDEMRSLYVDDAEVEHRLLELVPEDGVQDLLDIGTGTGRILQLLAPRTGRAVGIDLSREMLQVARSNLEGSRLRHCVVRHGDMYQLPASRRSFDLVTVHQVLHFAEQPGEVIAEAARVLRPGGRIIVVDFEAHDHDALRRDHAHLWLGFRDRDVTDWFAAAGLQPQDPIRLPGDPLSVGIWWATQAVSDAPSLVN
jgi:ArsR family transcriptional regulator